MNKTRFDIFLMRLKELMKEHNFNQVSLASQTGLNRSSISNWFSRSQDVNIDHLARIAIFFNCSVDYLIGLEDEFGNKTYQNQ